MEKLLLHLEEARQASALSRSRLYKLMASGELESVKVGRRRLIPAEALADYVERVRNESNEWPG